MYSVADLEKGEHAFHLTASLFRSCVNLAESLNPKLIDKNIRILSGYRPDDKNGDHKRGLAIDIDADDVESLFWFWATVVGNWALFQSMGVAKCFLLLHARGVHLSFTPAEGFIRGYESYNGGDRKDAASYPIPRFTGDMTSASQLLLLGTASGLYSVSKKDMIDYFSRSSVQPVSGCLGVIGFFVFLFGIAEVGIHYLNF